VARRLLYSPFELTIRGTDELRTYHLPIGVTTIGRNPGSDIFLGKVDISRQHAEIECTAAVGGQPATAVIRDVGSSNGTYLENAAHNREPLRSQIPITLRPGARIYIGTYTLTFDYHFTQMQLATDRPATDDDDLVERSRALLSYPYMGEIPPGLSRYSQRYLHYLPELYQPAAFRERNQEQLALLRSHEVAIQLVATDRQTGQETCYPIEPQGAVFGLFAENGTQELRMRSGHSSLTAYRQSVALQLTPHSSNDDPVEKTTKQTPTQLRIGQSAVAYPLAIMHDWGNTTILNWVSDDQQPRLYVENQPLPQQRLSTWPPHQPLTYGNYELHWHYTLDCLPVSFLSRFLALFESVTLPIESMLDEFSLYLDPQSSPHNFLPWLERWFRLPFVDALTAEQQQSIIQNLHLRQRRQLLIEAEHLFAQKGTRIGLLRWLELFTQLEPDPQPGSQRPIEIDDLTTTGDHFEIRFNQSPSLDLEIIYVLIDAFKPVHTTYEVKMP